MQNMYIVKGIVDLIFKKNVCRYPTFFLSFVAFSQYSKPSEDPKHKSRKHKDGKKS